MCVSPVVIVTDEWARAFALAMVMIPRSRHPAPECRLVGWVQTATVATSNPTRGRVSAADRHFAVVQVVDTGSMTTVSTTSYVARALLQATALAFVLSEVSTRFRSSRHSGGVRADRGSVVAVVVCIGAGVLIAAWCASTVTTTAIPGKWVPFVVGIVLMWLGIALRQWAVLTLGRYFTVVVRVADDHKVVAGGPYRWVRHPSYTGLLLTLVGLGVAFGNWLSVLALAILPTAGLVIRIRVEEAALLSALGDSYREYAEYRRRLVPGLW
jgi:protein-S-isoprenylcysteine O-methyltransferase Ste14